MRVLVVCVMALCAGLALARDPAVRAEFQRLNPCPATGERRGPCPGWVGDHIVPLCAGGLDTTANMQWQTLTDSRVKDIQERALCRQRKAKPPT